MTDREISSLAALGDNKLQSADLGGLVEVMQAVLERLDELGESSAAAYLSTAIDQASNRAP